MLRFLALPLFLLAAGALAQPLDFERRISPFPVLGADGEPYPFAFAGGFNNPRPQLADLDGDGDLDLFILEARGRMTYFENVAEGGGFAFEWRSDRYLGIDVGTWFRFGDLDGDGDLDLLVQKSPGQVRYFRNDDGAFVLAADPLLDTNGVPVNPEDPNVPALADVDGDGGLDLFLGRADSGKIRWYRHAGVDGGVPQFELAGEQFEDIVIFEDNPTCGADGDPIYVLPGGPAPGRGTLHGENALTFADVDADGDLDLFWGDFFTPSLYFFRNDGSATAPDMTLVSEFYPLDDPLTSGGYNVAAFGDLDGDGDLDLVIGIVGGFCSSTANLTENLYYLENTGTPAEPAYVERTSRLIESIDVGRASYPAFADLDGDGDLDLLVGSAYNPRADGPRRGGLFRFENTGTPTAPAYRLVDDDFLALDVDFAAHYAPAFGDLDGDGDLDLLVGTFGGKMAYLENDGGTFTLAVEAIQGLDVGSVATPTLGDLDGDGDLDLLVGNFAGRLVYFRNDGSAELPFFVEAALPGLEDLRVGRFSAPHLADVDGDGDLDLFVGSEREDVLFFRNVGTAAEPRFEREDFEAGAFRMNASPVLADLDGDGDLDLVSGSLGGGLLYFENREVAPPEPPAGGSASVGSFPNPFGERTTLRVSGTDGAATLAVFDVRGREVRRWALPPDTASVDWDGTLASGAEAPAGVYVARLTAEGEVLATRKLVRVR